MRSAIELRHQTFRIDDYVLAGERFHVARKRLAPGPSVTHDHDFHELFWIESGSVRHRVNGADQTLGRAHCVSSARATATA